MKSEEEMRKLVEEVRNVKPLEPSRRPPVMFWVYAALIILALIYALSRGGSGTPKFDIQRAVRKQQQEDARKNLEDAEAAYRRSLQPTPR